MTEPVVYVSLKCGAQVLKRRQDYDLESRETFTQLLNRVLDAPLQADAIVSATIYPDSREQMLYGTGVRDLGWYWGQEWAPSEDTDGDSGVQNGFTPGPASGGCGHAPLAPIALLGVALAATRRRC